VSRNIVLVLSGEIILVIPEEVYTHVVINLFD